MTYILFTQTKCPRCPFVKAYMEETKMLGEVKDATKELPFCASHGIASTPTVLFLADDGKELGRAYDVPGIKKFLNS